MPCLEQVWLIIVATLLVAAVLIWWIEYRAHYKGDAVLPAGARLRLLILLVINLLVIPAVASTSHTAQNSHPYTHQVRSRPGLSKHWASLWRSKFPLGRWPPPSLR